MDLRLVARACKEVADCRKRAARARYYEDSHTEVQATYDERKAALWLKKALEGVG